MQLAFEEGLRGPDLTSFNRCRCAGHLLFLSDIITSDGRSLDPRYISGKFDPIITRFDFPPEHPTQMDWARWTSFWASQSHFPRLGNWLSMPHFQWPWILSSEEDALFEAVATGWKRYIPLAGRTRGGTGYVLMGTVDTVPSCQWVSTKQLYFHGRTIITVSHPGISLPPSPPQLQSIWELLRSWGGDWMWTSLFFPNDNNDITWLAEAIAQGMIIGCTDGSYNGKRSTNHSSAGWILLDTASGLRLAGFYNFANGVSRTSHKPQIPTILSPSTTVYVGTCRPLGAMAADHGGRRCSVTSRLEPLCPRPLHE